MPKTVGLEDLIEYKKLLDMKLHESMSTSDKLQITRVPGGWIYENIIMKYDGEITGISACFVPVPK